MALMYTILLFLWNLFIDITISPLHRLLKYRDLDSYDKMDIVLELLAKSFFVMAVLKLFGVIGWSWGVITIPLWGPVVLLFVLFIVFVFLTGIIALFY